jgi:ATP-dependent Clp protease protease subunit
MKLLVLAALAAVTTGAAVFTVDPFNKSAPTSTSEVVVNSATVPGNITDARLKKTEAPFSAEKKIVKAVVNPKRVLYLVNEVDFGTSQFLSNEIKRLQKESNEPIWLLLDSPGGSVLDGATLISEMEASSAPVHTVCTRLCASMAAMIHSYGKQRYMLDRAILMYHPASAGVQGQVPNMLSLLNTINRYTDKMVANIVNRSSLSLEEYEKLVAYELWIDSEDAVNKKLTDSIINLNVAAYPDQTEEILTEDTPPEEGNGLVYKLISPHTNLWQRNARKNQK